MKRILYFIPLTIALLIGASSCLDDGDSDVDAQWKADNIAFYSRMTDTTVNGIKYFEPYSPPWGPGYQILVHWHNDRSLTAKNLVPLDNSTVDIKYQLRTYDGTVMDSSYGSTTYGDSIYRSKPMNNIPGMWALLTTMHVGDSVTCVIPYYAGYGSVATSKLKAYSTLIFDVKLKDIIAWEKPI